MDLFHIWMFLPGSHSDPEASAELWWVRSHLTWEQPIRGTGAGAGGGGGGGGRGAGAGGGGGGARGEAQVEPEAEECLWGVHLQKDQSRWESSHSKFFPPSFAAWKPQLLELSLANGEDFAKQKPKNLKNSGRMVCATRGWESFLFACIFEWHNSSSYVSQNFLQKQGENLISKKKDGYWLFLLLVQQTKSVAFTAVFNCSTTFSFDSNKDHWGCGL